MQLVPNPLISKSAQSNSLTQPPAGATAGVAVPGAGESMFARLMADQSAQKTPVKSAGPGTLAAQNERSPANPQSGPSGTADRPADTQPSTRSNDSANAEAQRHQLDGRLNQQQTERARLNAQREARQQANRALAKAPQDKPLAEPVQTAQDTVADADGKDQSPGADARNPVELLSWLAWSGGALAQADAGPIQASTATGQALPNTGDLSSTGIDAGASASPPAGAAPGVLNPRATPMDQPPDELGTEGPGGSALGGVSSNAGPARHHPASGVQTDRQTSVALLGASASKAAEAADSAQAWLQAGSGMTAAQTSATETTPSNLTAVAALVRSNESTKPASVGADGLVNVTGWSAANSATTDVAPATNVNLPTPVQAPEFRDMLAAQVSLLAKEGVQEAQLHLNPADMGPISVQITLDGTQARVDFGADAAATRQLIEAGLPELATALRDAGLTLSGGGVSQHARHRGEQPPEGQAGSTSRDEGNAGDAVTRLSVPTRRVALGRLDLYA